MPYYVNSPFSRPKLLQKGVPCYLLGSYSYSTGNTKLAVSQVALATNVATLTVQLIDGPKPVVGSLISVVNTTTGAGEFNVARAVITAVSITDSTGAGTISFALTAANVSATADFGTAIVEPAEVGETIANGSSIAACVQAPDGDSQFTLSAAVTFPTLPTACTVQLYGAIRDIDAEYNNSQSLGTVATVSGGAQTAGPVAEFTLQRLNFFRFKVSGLSGSGTIVAKIV